MKQASTVPTSVPAVRPTAIANAERTAPNEAPVPMVSPTRKLTTADLSEFEPSFWESTDDFESL